MGRLCKESTDLKCSSFSDLHICICMCAASSDCAEGGDELEELTLLTWLIAQPGIQGWATEVHRFQLYPLGKCILSPN